MLDVCGLTFDEVVSAVGPRPGQRERLRAAYRAAQRGLAAEFDLVAGVAPVARRLVDGDLIKFVQPTSLGFETESVIIPMRGAPRQQRVTTREWRSLCVSSQVGCALGCTFCETAQIGLRQNLDAGQIVGQFLAARRTFADWSAAPADALPGTPSGEIKNVVFMGMGEPMDNLDAVLQAVRVLTDPHGLSLGRDRITISTVGRTAGIRRLAEQGWKRINLAVSLNAPNDAIRSQIMPINRAEPMAALRAAMIAFPARRAQPIMIEYVLIPGVNDAPEHADELVAYLRPIRCCVNVIPYNPRRDSPWPAPREEAVVQFLDRLQAAGQFAKRRITKGRDHMAACGQLGNRAFARRAAPRAADAAPGCISLL